MSSSSAAAGAPPKGQPEAEAPTAPISFIKRAQEAGSATVLLGPFASAGRFDACLEGMVITKLAGGEAEAELVVTRALTNNYGTLHGGAISTVVDVLGTLALLAHDPSRAGVSVEMNQTFCTAAQLGQKLKLTGKVERYGRSTGFTTVELRQAEGERAGVVVALGRHTKVFPTPAAAASTS
eukprot:SAG22_NODE_4181_length_1355_cov_1.110669_1_plen_181_part_00